MATKTPSITDLAGQQVANILKGQAKRADDRKRLAAVMADENLDSISLGVPPHQLEELGAKKLPNGGYELKGQEFTHEGAIRLRGRKAIREALARDHSHRRSGVIGTGGRRKKITLDQIRKK